jgi:hypothetical protein
MAQWSSNDETTFMNRLTISLALGLLGLTTSQAGKDLPGLKAVGPDPSLGSELALFGKFAGSFRR